MKQRKFWLILLVVVLMVATAFATVGCKNGEEDPSPSDDPSVGADSALVESVSFAELPVISSWLGQDLTLSGGSLLVRYVGGGSETVAITVGMISGVDVTSAKEQTATVTYEGLTLSFSLKLAEDLVGAKTGAIASLRKSWEEMASVEDDYRPQEWEAMSSAVADAITAINAAENIEQVNRLKAQAITTLNTMPNKYEVILSNNSIYTTNYASYTIYTEGEDGTPIHLSLQEVTTAWTYFGTPMGFDFSSYTEGKNAYKFTIENTSNREIYFDVTLRYTDSANDQDVATTGIKKLAAGATSEQTIKFDTSRTISGVQYFIDTCYVDTYFPRHEGPMSAVISDYGFELVSSISTTLSSEWKGSEVYTISNSENGATVTYEGLSNKGYTRIYADIEGFQAGNIVALTIKNNGTAPVRLLLHAGSWSTGGEFLPYAYNYTYDDGAGNEISGNGLDLANEAEGLLKAGEERTIYIACDDAYANEIITQIYMELDSCYWDQSETTLSGSIYIAPLVLIDEA